MPRQARELANTGIYHAIVRGINRQTIFHDEQDFQFYLKNLEKETTEHKTVILGYCLMNNHIHLLINQNTNDISEVMHRLGTRYAVWYNKKYKRCGHVFQNRFKSECIEDDSYLLAAIRYIHQNPVKAFMVSKPIEYMWSSYRAYCGLNEYPPNLTDTDFILNIFSSSRPTALEQFHKLMDSAENDTCLFEGDSRLSDELVEQLISNVLGGRTVEELRDMPKADRNDILRSLKAINGVSGRQIARITGLGYQTVNRA